MTSGIDFNSVFLKSITINLESDLNLLWPFYCTWHSSLPDNLFWAYSSVLILEIIQVSMCLHCKHTYSDGC